MKFGRPPVAKEAAEPRSISVLEAASLRPRVRAAVEAPAATPPTITRRRGFLFGLQTGGKVAAGLVAHLVEPDFAAENPVDADAVGEDDGEADERDGEHDAKRFR